jgi:hypothetical protein
MFKRNVRSLDIEGRVELIEAVGCLSGSRAICRNRAKEGGRQAVYYRASEAGAERRRRSEIVLAPTQVE